jgi:hypothetical protein
MGIRNITCSANPIPSHQAIKIRDDGHSKIITPRKRWNAVAADATFGALGSFSRIDSYVNKAAIPINPRLINERIQTKVGLLLIM